METLSVLRQTDTYQGSRPLRTCHCPTPGSRHSAADVGQSHPSSRSAPSKATNIYHQLIQIQIQCF